MKLIKCFLLLLIPLTPYAQGYNRIVISELTKSIEQIYSEEFPNVNIGDRSQMNLDNTESMSVLILNHTRADIENSDEVNFASSCECHLKLDQLLITNAIGFIAGMINIIEINVNDSTFSSTLVHATDGIKSHKFDAEEKFIANISVPLKDVELKLTKDSKLEHKAMIRGHLIGTTINYYEEFDNDLGYVEVRTKVKSIFQCRIIDIAQTLMEQGIIKDLKEFEMMEKSRGSSKN